MQPYFFIGIEGVQLTPQDKKNLQHPSIAGVILFSRNYENKRQVSKLCQSIHHLRTDFRLQIAVDHEGGRVQRFQEPFTAIPSPSSLASKDLEEAKKAIIKYSDIASRELAECGIDINFAPCLDLEWGNSSVMAQRCYHSDPNIVASLSQAFMQAHHQNGVISVAKHFPGHGYATADSHLELPTDPRSYAQIETDINAFAQALPQTKAMMMAHILFPQVDAQIASFSPYWIKTILRQKLGFTGRIFSDDLQMNACDIVGDELTRVEKALSAGNDYLIWGNDLPVLSQLLEQQHDKLMATSINHGTMEKR